MTQKTLKQKKAYKFLREHFLQGKTFTKTDFFDASEWKGSSPGTYWSKHYEPLVAEVGSGRYRVSESFRRLLEWENFRRYVTQKRRAASEYTAVSHEHLVVFEFFLPLNNEQHLRATLDSMFYRDTIEARLRTLTDTALNDCLPAGTPPSASVRDKIDAIVGWISDRVVGYSINHVAGRFRREDLSSYEEVAELMRLGRQYLADETTAIVKFIFFCGPPATSGPYLETDETSVLSMFEPEPTTAREEAESEATLLRRLFYILFVTSVIEAVNGEDEIWMVESGMRYRLHRWKSVARANY